MRRICRVVAVEDLNGDGKLDASVANSTSNNNAILLGDGAGGFGPATLLPTGSHATSADLGDLDGDGDADLVVSSFFGPYWRSYRNDGAGTFAFHEAFPALSNPSCAALYDSDNDGDLDMALTDEIADLIILMENVGAVGVEALPSPEGIARLSNVPNPFLEWTDVRFHLATPGDVRLDVFDAGGRWVTGSGPILRGAGWQTLRFDGRNRFGRPLPPGLYFYRVTADRVVGHGRMIVTT